MSSTVVRLIALFLFILGAILIGFVTTQIPPYQSSGSLDLFAVGLLFLALLIGITGLGTLIALWLHQRWPTLAGTTPNKINKTPKRLAGSALRQGFLASVSLCAIGLFSMLRILDSIFVFVIILIAGLIETYFQSLERRL